jgi:hypothetical protein
MKKLALYALSVSFLGIFSEPSLKAAQPQDSQSRISQNQILRIEPLGQVINDLRAVVKKLEHQIEIIVSQKGKSSQLNQGQIQSIEVIGKSINYLRMVIVDLEKQIDKIVGR